MKTKLMICAMFMMLLVFTGSVLAAPPPTYNPNTLYGTSAGVNTDTDYSDTFIGYQSGYTNNSGTDNTFLGNKAGYANDLGNSFNTYIGSQAG